MSQALELQLTCPQCNVEFSYPGHTVVNMADEADSEPLWQLQNGTLNRVECPNCQAGGLIPIPVLLNVPEQEMLLVFAPAAEQMSEEQLGQIIGPVLQNFIGSLPEEAQAEYLLRPIVTDDLAALQQVARGELVSEDLLDEDSAEGEDFEEDEEDDDDDGEGLSQEEQQALTARMGLMQQLFMAQDSLERISLMRNSKDLVDEMFLEVIALMTEQAQETQTEIVPTLQKMMNEAEVFIASNQPD